MLAGLTPPDPSLTDGVVTLRVPDAARDAPTLAIANADPEIVRWMLGGAPAPGDAEALIASQLELWRRGTDAIFSIDAVGHQQRVGLVRVLFGLTDPFGFAEVGYMMLPAGRGRGYASRAVRLVARWTFEDLGIVRLQARTHTENVRSQRLLERVGFRREGIARAAHVLPVSRERIDCVMWSLLPGDAGPDQPPA